LYIVFFVLFFTHALTGQHIELSGRMVWDHMPDHVCDALWRAALRSGETEL
jgi:hypothetical protein